MGVAALSLLMQYVLFANVLTDASLALPRDSSILMERTSGMLATVLGVSFLVFLPLTFVIGVLTTFRIAGPVYRFMKFLEAVQRGENPNDFKLRRGDELQDLAELINSVTVPLRSQKMLEPVSKDVDQIPSLTALTGSGTRQEEAEKA